MKVLERIMKTNEFSMNELSSRVYLGYALLIAYVFENKKNQDFSYRRYLYDLQERDLNFYLDINGIEDADIFSVELFSNLNEYMKEELIKYPLYWNEYLADLVTMVNSKEINWEYIIQKVISPHRGFENQGDLLSDFLNEIIMMENKNKAYLLDGTFGSDKTFLKTRFSTEKKFDKKAYRYVAYESNEELYILGKLEMLFKNKLDISLHRAHPKMIKNLEVHKYQYVYANFINNYFYNSDSKYEDILELMEVLDEDGTGLFIVSDSFLNFSKEMHLRDEILSQYIVDAVISLKPKSKMLNLLILKRSANKKNEFIQFIQMDSLSSEEIKEVYLKKKEIEGKSIVIKLLDLKFNILIPEQYLKLNKVMHEIFGEVSVELDNLGNTMELSECMNFINGLNIPKGKIKDTLKGKYKLVKYSDFDEEINIDALGYVDIEEDHSTLIKHFLEPGDILITSRGQSIKIAYVNEVDEKVPVILAQNMFALRSKTNVSSKYVYNFLISPVGQYQLYSIQKGAAIKSISITDLKSTVIPKLTFEEQTQIVNNLKRINDKHLKKLEELMRERKSEIFKIYVDMGIGKAIKQ